MNASALPLLALAGALGGCATAPVKWQGAYLGVQRITPLDTTTEFRRERDNGSVYLNAIWTVGSRGSFQIEPILPLNGGEPILRLAFDVKIF